MKMSDAGLAFLRECEGFRARAYRDPVGVWTIGYGDTLDVQPGMIITSGEGEARLVKCIPQFEAFVDGLVKVALNQGQYDALVDFTYNLGPTALQGSTLLRKLNAGDYAGAAAEFPRWCHAGHAVLPGLVTRRARERAMFEGDGA
jgi:lysozyme